MKNMKLASKIALIISAMLVVVFAVFITITINRSSSAIGTSTEAELNSTSKANGLMVQEIINKAQAVAKDMSTYINTAYDDFSKKTPAEVAAEPLQDSVVFPGLKLDLTRKATEEFMIATAKNTAVNNDDVMAVGVLFEPKRFSDKTDEYSFYCDSRVEGGAINPYDEYATYSQQNFYKAAVAAKKLVFTEVYDYQDLQIISIAAPIYYDDVLQGVIVTDVDITRFAKIKTENSEYKSMYSTIYNANKSIVYDTEDLADVGKNMEIFFTKSEELTEVSTKMDSKKPFKAITTRENGNKFCRFYYPITAGEDTWYSMTAITEADMNASANQVTIMLIIIAVVSLVVIVLVVITILRRMIAPINKVVAAAKSLSEGDLNIHLDAATNDEIGILERAFSSTIESLGLYITTISNTLSEIANGNLDVTNTVEFKGDFKQIETSMDTIIESLNDTMSQINQSSEQVASGSDQVSSGAQALSQGATEQASSIEELSASIAEISGQISQNAANAATANSEAGIVEQEIENGDVQMQNLVRAMTEINDSSSEIGKIIKTIDDIAFQTNILALNAAVEAARAGSAGKGFAVVADEVRNLAGKSAAAAKNTTALIENSIKAVDNGSKMADATAQALAEITTGAKKITKLISEISDASNMQATSASQVTQGVEQISAVVQTNSATAEESAAASEELSGQAQILKGLVARFKIRGSSNATAYEPTPTQSSYNNDYSYDDTKY